jgi:hypothetical protein
VAPRQEHAIKHKSSATLNSLAADIFFALATDFRDGFHISVLNYKNIQAIIAQLHRKFSTDLWAT